MYVLLSHSEIFCLSASDEASEVTSTSKMTPAYKVKMVSEVKQTWEMTQDLEVTPASELSDTGIQCQQLGSCYSPVVTLDPDGRSVLTLAYGGYPTNKIPQSMLSNPNVLEETM